jgi:streptogramin lyase
MGPDNELWFLEKGEEANRRTDEMVEEFVEFVDSSLDSD